MKVALITIGNELLSGYTMDTNATWIGKELGKIGGRISIHLTIGDDENQILKALKILSDDVFAVIVTGGLGPTHDDVTSSAFYTYFDDKPFFDNDYWEWLKARFSKANYSIPDLNRNQALRPEKGKVISNPLGSARGLHFEKEGCHFFALPGVPQEMKSMMKETILPFLKKRVAHHIIVRTIRTTGIPESALAEKISDVLNKYSSSCTVAFLPKLIGVDIRITDQVEENVSNLENALMPIIKKYVYGFGNKSLEQVIGDELVERGLTLSTAESCTGGLLGHRLTNVSGSSAYFVGGVVTYSNKSKMSLLGVSEETLNRMGAVSEETAREMAQGVRSLLGSDIGLSITGIAGPTGGTPDKPVGLVYIGMDFQNEVSVRKNNFFRDRDTNKLLSSQVALNMIRLSLGKYGNQGL